MLSRRVNRCGHSFKDSIPSLNGSVCSRWDETGPRSPTSLVTMMKIVRSSVLLLLAIFSVLQADAAYSNALRVVSFNIRCTNPNDGTNSWDLRREIFFGEVKRLAPSLIGFQE